jgi:flagellar basal-body rod modification protein FlgD
MSHSMHSIPLGLVTHVHSASNSPGSGTTGSSGSSGTDSSGASATASGIAALPANMQISQTGFLQLISTQMQNQDPLNPTDPTQFLAQIEGLSEVSSLQSLQSSISGLASGLQASQVISGTSLLGHSVLAPGNTANIAAGGTVSGAVSAPSGASSLAVSVTSSSGALVDAFNVSPQASGYTPISWNGTTSTGTAAPAGQYTIQVNAQVGNATQSVSPLLYSQVTSVTIDPSTQALDLNTNNGTIPLSSVVNIQ